VRRGFRDRKEGLRCRCPLKSRQLAEREGFDSCGALILRKLLKLRYVKVAKIVRARFYRTPGDASEPEIGPSNGGRKTSARFSETSKPANMEGVKCLEKEYRVPN
jgi:hypothetical protein